MKKYSADAIRNVCLLGHGGVGKTSLADAFCYTAKTTGKLGKVDAGTSLFDGRSDEKERKMTISMTPGYCEWQDVKINFLNVPGFLDFTGETMTALRVVETAVVVVDAVAGVQVGTEVGYRAVKESGAARVFFVNGMDKENADFGKTLETVRDRKSVV
jgi:elongation factor G